jgi:hypothetical protein
VDDVDATCGLLWVGFWTLLVDNVSVEVRAEAMAKAIFDSWGDENETDQQLGTLLVLTNFT